MKIEVILSLGIVWWSIGLEAQPRAVDLSREYTEEEYFKDDDIKEVFDQNENFTVDFDSPASYATNITLFMKSSRGPAVLMSMRWDSTMLTVYQGRMLGGIGSLKGKAIQFSAASETYQSFVGLVKDIDPSFFKQTTKIEMKYHETEFVIFKRTVEGIEWALTAFNARQYKDASDYPGFAYRDLVAFILLEFGSAP